MEAEPVGPTDLERVFLLPGEYHVTEKPKFLATLLGSCVAVCLYNKHNGSAALNHFVRDRSSAGDNDIGRFGDLSIKHIVKGLKAFDPDPSHYEAKIYGGGNVVGHLNFGVNIGAQNISVAKEVLGELRIPIVEDDTGGGRGRKIYFNTSNFDVMTRFMGQEKRDFSKQDVRVLIVDDSMLVRSVLRGVIEQTPGMKVVAEASDAFEARDLIISTDPDVISLDIVMPKIDGLKFLEKIMGHYPKPVVIVSTIAKNNSDITKKAQKLGAVGVVDKDVLEIYKGQERAKKEYIPLLRMAADRKVEKTVKYER